MPLKRPSRNTSADATRPVGPPPDPAGHPTVGLEDASALLSRFKVAEDNGQLPPLNSLVISIQGRGLSGKTTLIAGNRRCAIAKLPDGSPIVRGKRATLFELSSLDEFDSWIVEMKDYARAHGTEGNWQCIAIDPVILLTGWLSIQELEFYNEEAQVRFTNGQKYNRIPSDEVFRSLRNISEIPGSGVWYKIAERLGTIITDFAGLGWGVFPLVHYNQKVVYKGGKPDHTEWLPDIPPSSAAVINKYRDMVLVCTREATTEGPLHFIEFGTTAKEGEIEYSEAGSRVPIGVEGALALPEYGAGQPVTSWDALTAEYAKACERWKQEYDSFQASQAAQAGRTKEIMGPDATEAQETLTYERARRELRGRSRK